MMNDKMLLHNQPFLCPCAFSYTGKGFRTRLETEREKGRKKREMMQVWDDE